MQTRKMLWIVTGCLVLTLHFSANRADANNDFPNYFMELVAPGSERSRPDTSRAEKLVEDALFSILERLQVPHVVKENVGGSPQLGTDGFFGKVEKKVKERDPGARVYVAGGVVRSLLGYIYKKVYRGHQKNPSQTTEQVLKKIISGLDETGKRKEILSLSALGIGSDLDILVEPSPEGKMKEERVIKEVTQFINSAEEASKLESVKSKLKYAIVPVGDVKDYHQQIHRASAQGGSALDWLAFPISRASGSHMRTPEKHSGVFQDFILGEYAYLPPDASMKGGATDKQTIRGLRPLLEIPFLHLTKSGVDQISSELSHLIGKLKRGEKLSVEAFQQFEKMIRNARFEAAHNRFRPDINPENPQQGVESLVYQLSEAAGKNESNLPWVPEFARKRSIALREGRDNCALEEKKILEDVQSFVSQETDQGILYHGTPKLENMLNIVRNGLILSTTQQGRGEAFGSGVYSTKRKNTARVYGVPIELKLNVSKSLRILDWAKVKGDPWIQKLEEQAKQKKWDVFKYLSEYCDVDIVKVTEIGTEEGGEILIQNVDAVKLPKSFSDIIAALGKDMEHLSGRDCTDPTLSEVQAREVVNSILHYAPFHRMGELLGIKKLIPTVDPSKKIKELLSHSSPAVREVGAEFLPHYQGEDLEKVFESALKDPESSVRAKAASALSGYKGKNAHLYKIALADSDPSVNREIMGSLFNYNGEDFLEVLKQGLLTTENWGGYYAAVGLQHYEGDQEALYRSLLQDQNLRIREATASALYAYRGKDRKGLFEKAFHDSSPEVRKEITQRFYSYDKEQFSELEDLYLAGLQDPDSEVRSNVLKSLEYYVTATSDSFIAKLLEHDHPDLKRAGASLLKRYKGTDAKDRFKMALKDRDLLVRRAATSALQGYNGPNAKKLFEIAFQDRESLNDAISSLQGFAEYEEMNPLVLKAFSDEDPNIRRSASTYLIDTPISYGKKIPLSRIRDLGTLFDHQNPDVRTDILSAFAKLLTHSDSEIRKAADSILKKASNKLGSLAEVLRCLEDISTSPLSYERFMELEEVIRKLDQ